MRIRGFSWWGVSQKVKFKGSVILVILSPAKDLLFVSRGATVKSRSFAVAQDDIVTFCDTLFKGEAGRGMGLTPVVCLAATINPIPSPTLPLKGREFTATSRNSETKRDSNARKYIIKKQLRRKCHHDKANNPIHPHGHPARCV